MTRAKREEISSKLRAARELVEPITHPGLPQRERQTQTLCQRCFVAVYDLGGGLTVDLEGGRHRCSAPKQDTIPVPAGDKAQ
jgi:hypothetical protein